MIGLLRGRLAVDEPGGAVVLDVAGVGYELATPLGTLDRAARDGEQLTLHVHTHVREDALDLYGFASELERRVFRLLISVPNIGPKTALGVLSALPPPELAVAIQAGNTAKLHQIPGVGKKTAERLVLELKEKLPALPGEGKPERPSAERPDAARKLLLALTNMGYRSGESERAIQALGERVKSDPLDILLREALARLST